MPDKQLGIRMKSVGPLLSIWDTLNVHDTVYALDSFTLDDFIEAMCYSSEEEDCELLNEAHCAVLKQIVTESGRLQLHLPKKGEPDDSDDSASSKSTSPEPEPEPLVRTTRSSLRKSEANAIVKQRTPTPEPPKQIHKAAEFVDGFDWIARCKVRNFLHGGWQAVLVGLLYRLSFDPVYKEACDEILAALVPDEDEEPTVETIAHHYSHMDVNLRISALNMAVKLTIPLEIFRDALNTASTDMTKLRKEKIEYQKQRRVL